MKIYNFLLLAFALSVSSEPLKRSFEGYHLVRLAPKNQEQIDSIQKLEITDPKFDIWNTKQTKPVTFDVLLSPKSLIKYQALFSAKNIAMTVLNNNIQNQINEEKQSMMRSRYGQKSVLFRYLTYQEINEFIDTTVAANPEIASSYKAGSTIENRDINVIVLNPVKTSTRSLWIDCGIHAREWVTPATCIYTIQTLLDEFKNNDPETVSIFNKYQIHIMPVVNPDGYVFSHDYDRMWRKNRKRIRGWTSCQGVDINRNFGYKWMEDGASDIPCSEVYAGTGADSELETQAIENSLKAREGNWDVYFNVHSYGNWWLLPYSWSETIFPDDYNDLLEKARIGTAAIKAVNGEDFIAGSSSQLMYVSAGSTIDWAKAVMGIKYPYLLELRPGSKTPEYWNLGFVMPEHYMKQIAPETYAGIKSIFYTLAN